MLENVLILLVIILAASTAYLAYERHNRRNRKAESDLYIQALQDLLNERPEAAFTKLRQVVAEDTNNIDAYLRLGQILRVYKQPERAVQVHKDLTLRTGLDRSDKTAILMQLTEDYITLGDNETAEKALKELIVIDPRSRWAHSHLLKVQERQQKWDQAYDTAVALLKLEGNKSKKPLARFKYQMAQQLYKKREYHKARIVFKEAIGLDPTHVEAYLAIGDSYAQEDRLEDAVNFWMKLISAVPDKGHLVIDRLKRVLFDLGRYGDIVNICENILEHSPKNLQARRTLAEFYEKKGDLDAATEKLESLIDDYPEDLSTIVEVIRIYSERGERRKLQDLLRRLEKQGARPEHSSGANPAPDATPVPR